MKRILSILLVVITCFSIVSCGEKEEASSSSEVESSVAENEVKINQVIETENAKFEIKFKKFSKEVEPTVYKGFHSAYVADEGKIYLDIYFSYTNLSADTINLKDVFSSAQLTYAIDAYAGNKYTGLVVLEKDDGGNFEGTKEISPQTTKNCHYLVELPKAAESNGVPIIFNFTIDSKTYTFNVR